jgi:hypothetical protein
VEFTNGVQKRGNRCRAHLVIALSRRRPAPLRASQMRSDPHMLCVAHATPDLVLPALPSLRVSRPCPTVHPPLPPLPRCAPCRPRAALEPFLLLLLLLLHPFTPLPLPPPPPPLPAAPCRPRAALAPFLLLLHPYAPHIAEELWAGLGHPQTLAYEQWPQADESLLVVDSVKLPVQVGAELAGGGG